MTQAKYACTLPYRAEILELTQRIQYPSNAASYLDGCVYHHVTASTHDPFRQLWYFDERTPPDWEPKHFEAADPSDLCFRKEVDHHSLRVRIGELRTPHHTLKVSQAVAWYAHATFTR